MRTETIEQKVERWKQATVLDSEVAEVVSAILLASHRVFKKEVVGITGSEEKK